MLGKRFRVPWVAELRDLWTDAPYYDFPAWRKILDRILERRLLRQAAQLVTVTPTWGQALESSYDKPVSVVVSRAARPPVLRENRRGAYAACVEQRLLWR